jgi:hypothetical protein
MRKTSLALAALATVLISTCVATGIVPAVASDAQNIAAVPNSRANPAITKPKQEDVIILTREQMNDLATSNPALHSKLTLAAELGKAPNLSREEKGQLKALTLNNLTGFRAGDAVNAPVPSGRTIACGVVTCVAGVASKGNFWVIGIGGIATLVSYYFDAVSQGYVNRTPVRSAAPGQGQPSLKQRNQTVVDTLNSKSVGEGTISTSTGGSRITTEQTGER